MKLKKPFAMDHDDAQDASPGESFTLKMLPTKFTIPLWVLGSARLRATEAQMHFGGPINRQQA